MTSTPAILSRGSFSCYQL